MKKNHSPQSYTFSGVVKVSSGQDTPHDLNGAALVSARSARILSLVPISIAHLGSCDRMDTQAHLWVSDGGKAAALLSSEHSFIQMPDCVALRACFCEWTNDGLDSFLQCMGAKEQKHEETTGVWHTGSVILITEWDIGWHELWRRDAYLVSSHPLAPSSYVSWPGPLPQDRFYACNRIWKLVRHGAWGAQTRK